MIQISLTQQIVQHMDISRVNYSRKSLLRYQGYSVDGDSGVFPILRADGSSRDVGQESYGSRKRAKDARQEMWDYYQEQAEKDHRRLSRRCIG